VKINSVRFAPRCKMSVQLREQNARKRNGARADKK